MTACRNQSTNHLLQDAELQSACLQIAEVRLPEQFKHLGLTEALEGNALTTTTRLLKRFLQHDVHAAVQQDSRLKLMHESAEVFNQDTERCFEKLSVRLPVLLSCWAICKVWVVRSSLGAIVACYLPLLHDPYPCFEKVLQLDSCWQGCKSIATFLRHASVPAVHLA